MKIEQEGKKNITVRLDPVFAWFNFAVGMMIVLNIVMHW